MSALPFMTRLLHAHRFEQHRRTLQAIDEAETKAQDKRVREALGYAHRKRDSRVEVLRRGSVATETEDG